MKFWILADKAALHSAVDGLGPYDARAVWTVVDDVVRKSTGVDIEIARQGIEHGAIVGAVGKTQRRLGDVKRSAFETDVQHVYRTFLHVKQMGKVHSNE